MTASRSLPPRPSLESLRKHAKKLARERRVTVRDAQLAIAREYGYAGWRDLVAEVSARLGNRLEWAATEARRVIHDNDVKRLKQLLAEYPALLSWRGTDSDGTGGLLGIAAGAYGDSFDPAREQMFTRAACAEVLIDAGAVVMPSVLDGLIESRARGLLSLFHRKGLLPRTLLFFAALGDLDAIRGAGEEDASDLTAVSDAFLCACRFEHEAAASALLERSVALDPELGARIDHGVGRLAFVRSLITERALAFVRDIPRDPWRVFLMEQVMRAVQHRDLPAFTAWFQREPWLLGDAAVGLQVGIIERATLRDGAAFITTLLQLEPALLRRQPPPPSQAIEFALTYARPHLIPLLARIWPLPDDLPHAAGMGNLARVKQLFAECRARPAQQELDTALAFAVINRHFDVADVLLEHGADINTRWGSHEPASILHELVGQVGTGENPANYESMRFLIDRGIDMTIEDYRWNSTARGWAIYAVKDMQMAQWLEDAERERAQRTR